MRYLVVTKLYILLYILLLKIGE